MSIKCCLITGRKNNELINIKIIIRNQDAIKVKLLNEKL